MRELILNRIKEIKDNESGFTSLKWYGFNVGCFHISKCYPEGMPDEILLDFYIEVLKWQSK